VGPSAREALGKVSEAMKTKAKTKIIGGIKWETDPKGDWLTRKPKRFLECRLECWVCERALQLGDEVVYLRAWGRTAELAVERLLCAEQQLIEELSE